MTSPSSVGLQDPQARGVAEPHLRGRLGTGGLLLTALALNAPLAMMAGFLPVEIGIGLGAATPVVFLVLMVLVLLFAVGLLAMARTMSKPGAYYTYITAALGRTAGLGAGVTALVAYLLLGSSSYILTGLLVQEMFHAFGGPTASWWVWSLLAWAVVSGLSLLNVDVSTKVLGVFLGIEVLIVLLWDVRVLFDGGPLGRAVDLGAQLGTGSIGVALLFGVAFLSGFESLQVFRAEARDPERTLPRASYLTVASLAGFYALGSWIYLVAFGTDAAIASAAAPAESYLGSLAQYAGQATADIATVALVTSAIASLLATQNIAARYVFALGRDGVFPGWLGRVHPRHHAPTRAAAVVGAVLVAVLASVAVLGLDPVTTYVALAGISLWGLIGMMFVTSVAIVRYFRVHDHATTSPLRTVVAPMLAACGFGYVMYQATINREVLIGGGPVVATTSLLALTAVALGAVGYAAWLHANRRDVWLRIGSQDD